MDKGHTGIGTWLAGTLSGYTAVLLMPKQDLCLFQNGGEGKSVNSAKRWAALVKHKAV